MTDTIQTARFQFPGFTFEKQEDTSTYDVEIGVIREGGHEFVVRLLRKKEFTHLGFLISQIANRHGDPLWAFQYESFDGIGMLAKAGESTVVALLERGRTGYLKRIMPLARLYSTQPISINRMIELKKAAAAFLNRDYVLSETEMAPSRAVLRQQDEARAAADKAAAEAREKERLEKLAALMARKEVQAFTANGQRRRGLPMLKGEWQTLPDGTFVILVESIGENGAVGKPIESFRVVKQRGRNPEKGLLALVFAIPPTAKVVAPTAPKAIGTAVIMKGEEAFEVALYASLDEIRSARELGLNSGAYVAVKPKKPGKLEVYSVTRETMDVLGHFVPLE